MSKPHWGNSSRISPLPKGGLRGVAVATLLMILFVLSAPSAHAAPVCACYYDRVETQEGQILNRCTLQPVTDEFDTIESCQQSCENIYSDGLAEAVFAEDSSLSEAEIIEINCREADLLAQTISPVAPLPDTKRLQYIKPNLIVPINLTFTPILLKDGKLQINYIADYITGVYKLLIGASIFFAIVFVMIGGLQFVFSSGSGSVDKAKTRIKNAITGLILLLGVTLILYTVNPKLTLLHSVKLTLVEGIGFAEEEEPDFVQGEVATTFGTPKEGNIIGEGKTQVPSDLTDLVDAAAVELSSQNFGMLITSSFRSVEKQIELINQNCKNPPGAQTCDPKDDPKRKSGKRPQTCILRDKNPANCPHTTGRALDIWGARKNPQNGAWMQCISQDDCLANKAACRANECQGALIGAMKNAGFCVLDIEPWHFEKKPPMSSGCN